MRNVWGSCRRPRPEALVVCCAGDSGCRLNRDHDYPVEILPGQSSRRGVDAARSKSHLHQWLRLSRQRPARGCTERTRVSSYGSVLYWNRTLLATHAARGPDARRETETGVGTEATQLTQTRDVRRYEHSPGARSPSPVLSQRGNGIACRNATPEGLQEIDSVLSPPSRRPEADS